MNIKEKIQNLMHLSFTAHVEAFLKGNIGEYTFKSTMEKIQKCESAYKKIFGRYHYPDNRVIQQNFVGAVKNYLEGNIGDYTFDSNVTKLTEVIKTENRMLLESERTILSSAKIEEFLVGITASAKKMYLEGNIGEYSYNSTKEKVALVKKWLNHFTNKSILLQYDNTVSQPSVSNDDSRELLTVESREARKKSFITKMLQLVRVFIYLHKKSKRPQKSLGEWDLLLQKLQVDMTYKKEIADIVQVAKMMPANSVSTEYKTILSSLIDQCVKDSDNQKLGAATSPMLLETLTLCKDQIKALVDAKVQADTQELKVMNRYLKAKI